MPRELYEVHGPVIFKRPRFGILSQILTRRFHRLNPPLEKPMDLDAIDQFDEMRAAAQKASLEDSKTHEPTVTWMTTHFFGSRAAA